MDAGTDDAQQAFGIHQPARARRRHAQVAAQIARRERAIAIGEQPIESALVYDVAAVLARARSQIQQVIGGAHHLGIVLHNYDGIAQLAQFFEDADQPPCVAAMQADGWLIEHVACAHQTRTQASGELDALGFAAGKRGGQPVQRQVLETHVVQELQPLADLHQDLLGDGGFFRLERQRVEELRGLGDIEAHHLGQVAAAYAHVQRLFAQAGALALRAQRVAAVTAEEDAHVQLVFLGFQVSEEAADEIVHQLALFAGQVGEGRAKAHLAAGGLAEIAEPRAEFRLRPGVDRAIIERKRFVGNHPVQVEIDGVAEALAARAGADRRVEAEQNGLRDCEFHAARLALELLVEAQRPGRRGGAFEDYFTSLAITDFDRIDQALMQAGADRDAIHQHQDRLAEIDIEQRLGRRKLENPARLKQPCEAFLAQLEEVVAQ